MKYNAVTTKDDLYGLFEKGQHMISDFWNVLDHPDFPFVTLSSNTNTFRNFPPYNIVEDTEGKVRLEVAVAGYSKDRLKVELQGKILFVTGLPKTGNEKEVVRHRGLTNAAFQRTFEMNPKAYIENVALVDGILTITVATKKEEPTPRTAFEIK